MFALDDRLPIAKLLKDSHLTADIRKFERKHQRRREKVGNEH